VKTQYEEGIYKVRIIDQGFNAASTGTGQFWIKFLVVERIEPFSDAIEQLSRMMYFAITNRTADWVMHDLHTLGFKGDRFDNLDPRVAGFESLAKNEIEVACKLENGQDGTPREKWSLRSTGRPISVHQVSELNKFLSKKPAPRPVMAPVAAVDGISDDDVPF
jgi:hypothetical protein